MQITAKRLDFSVVSGSTLKRKFTKMIQSLKNKFNGRNATFIKHTFAFACTFFFTIINCISFIIRINTIFHCENDCIAFEYISSSERNMWIKKIERRNEEIFYIDFSLDWPNTTIKLVQIEE